MTGSSTYSGDAPGKGDGQRWSSKKNADASDSTETPD
jgi:hypothetical protein